MLSEIMGEYLCIMLCFCFLVGEEESLDGYWVDVFYEDFRVRFIFLMGFVFRDFVLGLCLFLMVLKLNWDEK